MKQLNQWLSAETGRAARLAETLAVSPSHISQVRSGLRKIPDDWMPVIEIESGGVLTIVDMVMHQTMGVVNARRERIAKRRKLSANEGVSA